jgi:hypothetical protein
MDDHHDENDNPRPPSTSCEDEAQLLCLKRKFPMRIKGMKSNSCLDTCILELDKELCLRRIREHRSLSRQHSGSKGKPDLDNHHDENEKPTPSSTSCEDEAPPLRLKRKFPKRTKGMKEQRVFFERANNVRSPFLPLLKRHEYQGFPLLKRRPSGNDDGLATMPPTKRRLIFLR